MSTERPAGEGVPEAPAPVSRRSLRAAARSTASLVGRILLLVAGLLILWPAVWGGFTGLTVVHGHSMEPSYVAGDLVLTLRQSSYAVGDVVSYVVPAGQDGAGGRVIHRIHTIDDTGDVPVYTTLGDNNPEPDIWRITPADITGKAILRVPGVGTMLGGQTYLLLIGAAAGLIVLVLLWPGKKKSPHSLSPRRRRTQDRTHNRRGHTMIRGRGGK